MPARTFKDWRRQLIENPSDVDRLEVELFTAGLRIVLPLLAISFVLAWIDQALWVIWPASLVLIVIGVIVLIEDQVVTPVRRDLASPPEG